MELASQQVAPQLCCALARLCGQTTQGGRAFAAHIFKECKASCFLAARSYLTLPDVCESCYQLLQYVVLGLHLSAICADAQSFI